MVSITTYVKWDGSAYSNTCAVTTGSDKYMCELDQPGAGEGNSQFLVVPRH